MIQQLPVFSIPLTFIILSGVMLVRYFSLVGFAYWGTEKLNRMYGNRWLIDGKGKALKSDILTSVISSLIFAASGTFIIRLWQTSKLPIYSDMSQYGWGYFILSPFLFMFLHDSYFYWTHRWMHRPSLFKSIHRVHHESRIPTAWTAFAFHPWEALIQALALPLILWLMPLHWMMLLVCLMLMTVLGIFNHLGSEFYPKTLRTGFPFRYLINATHHQLHHQRVNRNYGLYFTFWDLAMRTEHE